MCTSKQRGCPAEPLPVTSSPKDPEQQRLYYTKSGSLHNVRRRNRNLPERLRDRDMGRTEFSGQTPLQVISSILPFLSPQDNREQLGVPTTQLHDRWTGDL